MKEIVKIIEGERIKKIKRNLIDMGYVSGGLSVYLCKYQKRKIVVFETFPNKKDFFADLNF